METIFRYKCRDNKLTEITRYGSTAPNLGESVYITNTDTDVEEEFTVAKREWGINEETQSKLTPSGHIDRDLTLIITLENKRQKNWLGL